MAKVTLSDVSNILGNPTSAQNTINANNDAIETALENTLSRDGTTPNQMNSDLDMNGFDVLNVYSLDVEELMYSGIPLSEIVTDAQAAQAAAESARNASQSAALASQTAATNAVTTVAVVQGFVSALAGGTTNQVLQKNSNADYDYKWTTINFGVNSFNGRTGTVLPAANDYSVSDINGLSTQLAAKAPLASPTFTGDPKAPTPTTGDNDTSIATTAFVQTAVNSAKPTYQTLVSASGTSINLTGISTNAKRITLVLDLSPSAAMQPIIQLGTGGVLETTGYRGASAGNLSGAGNTATPTSSFILTNSNVTNAPFDGLILLTRQDPGSNKWIINSQLTYGASGLTWASGSKTLAGTLDRLQISSAAGTATFSGNIGIIIEAF